MARKARPAGGAQPPTVALAQKSASARDGLTRGFELALAAGWRPRIRSEQSIRTYLHGVIHYQGWCARAGVTPLTATRDDLRAWLAELRRERAAATAQLYVLAVRTFHRWLVDEGERPDDPTEKLSAPARGQRLTDPLSDADIGRVLRALDRSRLTGARDYALVLTLLDTALRREELAGMTVTDALADTRHGIARVVGKGDKERLVRLSPATQQAIDRYVRKREQAGIDSEWLWLGQGGRPLSGAGVYEIVTRLGKRLGLDLHPHRWRHTALQAMLDAGMDRESVRQIAGHESDEILRRYTRATDARRAIEQHRRGSPVERLVRGRR